MILRKQYLPDTAGWNQCTYKLIETVAVHTGPLHIETRWDHSIERQKWTWVPKP